ncbi:MULTISPECIES: MFS transporter [unclassified Desulfovibrio]|uniref:MFS transporter n=1 Tax=unclassified Desulfovibrio TaxID=2593640 RepID=UPI0013EC6B87|nr:MULTISPECIES: MFS transporter [unclassified Desulfovibrio]
MQPDIGEEGGLGPGTLLLMIAAACLLLANLYYPQPILGEVAQALRLPEAASGAVITAGQLGYIAGLLLVAPLGDMWENRRLCAAMTAGAGLCALAAAGTGSAPLFLLLMVLMGVFATATQVLVVFATALAGPARSGKTLGIMACGLFLGIALSRPVASLVTGLAGWRAVYLGSGVALLATGLCLWRFLPGRAPAQGALRWRALMASLWPLLRFPLLLRRTLLSSGAFFSFSMFWSTVPLYLGGQLHMAQARITAFALAGLVTPPCMLMVGKLLDKGLGRHVILAALGSALTGWALVAGGPAWLGVFVASALLLDPSSSAVTVSIQQKILSGAPGAVRGRLNSLNISMNFLGGAAGAALGPFLLTRCGLAAVALAGALLLACLFCSALKAR